MSLEEEIQEVHGTRRLIAISGDVIGKFERFKY